MVPFETAKLLKEKGLSQYCDMFYNEFGRLCDWSDIGNIDKMLGHFYAAPTYHKVVNWLEEKEGILIELDWVFEVVNSRTVCWRFKVYKIHPKDSNRDEMFMDIRDNYHTREEAMNAAILKALLVLL